MNERALLYRRLFAVLHSVQASEHEHDQARAELQDLLAELDELVNDRDL